MKHFTAAFVKLCKKGDRQAQRQLFETLYASMFRVSQRYIPQHTEAEDCTMRALMRMYQRLPEFEFNGEHSLFMWVRKMVVNEALMELRKKNSFYLMTEETVAEIPDQSDVLQQMHAEELVELITQLPTGYRTVLNLFVVEGYAHKEIAEMLGITESTSKTQYQKARARLKKMVEQHGWRSYGKLGE